MAKGALAILQDLPHAYVSPEDLPALVSSNGTLLYCIVPKNVITSFHPNKIRICERYAHRHHTGDLYSNALHTS